MELVRMVRAAILDDYQNVALKVADWSTVNKDIEVKVFNAPLGDDNAVIKALQGFAIVNMMRERTPFSRKVIEGLPDMKLLITTGARKGQGSGRGLRLQGGPVRQSRHRQHPHCAERPLARPGRGERTRPDEEDRLSRQYVARAHRRREGADRGAERQVDRGRRPRRVRH